MKAILITFPAAAEITGKGEAAIRKAVRDGRIHAAASIMSGGNGITFVNFESLVHEFCPFGLAPKQKDMFDSWDKVSITIRAATGAEFRVLGHRTSIFVYDLDF